MKILVTGASGFLGKNFLNNTRHKDLFTLSTSNITSHKIHKHIIGDLSDPRFIQGVLNEKFDVVIHLAWIGLPQRTSEVNIQNSILYKSIMELISESGITKNIFIGSCLEYGKLVGKVDEKTHGIEIDDFGRTKLELCQMAQKFEIPYNWLRLFYTFGPYQHSNSLIKSIQRDLLSNNQVKLNSPSLSHDFIYITDVVELIDFLCTTDSRNSIYNVGSGVSTSTGEIANIISKLLGRKPSFGVEQQPALTANISKAATETGWYPRFTIDKGIEATLSGSPQ